jgi:hypothetical protein
MQRLYSVTELLDFMAQYGLPQSRQWIYYNERIGRLKSPRLPHGRHDRAYTLKQMQEIVVSFYPGGKGYWSYEKDYDRKNNFTSATVNK